MPNDMISHGTVCGPEEAAQRTDDLGFLKKRGYETQSSTVFHKSSETAPATVSEYHAYVRWQFRSL